MKTQRTSSAVGLILALLLTMQPSLATAQQAGVFSDRAYPFTDLPGVTTQKEAEAADEVVCTQTFDTANNRSRRFGEASRPGYTCTQNGRTYSSERPPLSRERDLRGLGW
ncbi:hypothetical protein GGQ64_001626 [Rhizobium azooxidifex]|uniref:Uncharacterized protein n=1 Tax=Mycoplana azooxidifex TaxID=1636188 RepID=A0A7W6D9A3_9HYPH|nr:hypothetical protein [Mycoplana azooxidifex]MBB3976437.1 hypothetical protein [Mycoplana azooxidifex]